MTLKGWVALSPAGWGSCLGQGSSQAAHALSSHPFHAVFRQLNTAIAVSQMASGQCRLAPLIQVIQDCSHLYHYTVKLLFKLHSCELPR